MCAKTRLIFTIPFPRFRNNLDGICTAYTLSEPCAPIAQGIERRSPEAEAQVRFLLGAREYKRLTARARVDRNHRQRLWPSFGVHRLRNLVRRNRIAFRFLLARRQHPVSDGFDDGNRCAAVSALASLPDVFCIGLDRRPNRLLDRKKSGSGNFQPAKLEIL